MLRVDTDSEDDDPGSVQSWSQVHGHTRTHDTGHARHNVTSPHSSPPHCDVPAQLSQASVTILPSSHSPHHHHQLQCYQTNYVENHHEEVTKVS